MVYITPTEASNGSTYMYIAYWMLTIPDLTYIWNNFGLTADGSNEMSVSAELKPGGKSLSHKTKGLAFFKLHNKDY